MAPNTVQAGLYMPQTYSFLSPETFETLVEGYINQLHIRKRNKALINQQLANDCLMVLTNPENTAIFNPKFRWWVRKHFVFTVVGELRILMDKKNGKPVCVREQLYDKVCYFHHIIGHGGRDKTFAAITKSYSKVPAELVSLFTKNCQTCLGVRKYSKNKRPILSEFEYPGHHHQQQQQPQHHHQQQQQQQQQQQSHHHAQQLQLTCNTNFAQSQQSLHGMITKSEHGTLSPISPMMNHSGSGFFNNYAQHHQHHMHQQALNTHLNMSMGLSDLALGNGHTLNGLNNNNLSTCSTPTVMGKMELPLHSLMHGQNGLMNGGLSTPSDLSDPSSYHHHHHNQYLDQGDQYNSVSSPESSSDAYSPTLQQQYLPEQQYLSANEYSSAFQTQQGYQAAFALIQQQHAQIPTTQSSQPSDLTSSPVLSQSQIFHKQIQQEHHRFQQEQHKFLPEALMTSNLGGTTSSAPSAVPSMTPHHTTHSQIPTPTSATPLSTSLSAMSSLLGHDHHNHHNHQQQECGSMEDKAHHHLSNVVELVAASEL